MTSRTPVYVATGFLDAGKTRLLNGVLRRRLAEGVRPLVLQFESGEEALLPLPSSGAMEFPKRELERDPEEIARRIAERLGKGDIDEVWVEWNGVVPLGALQSMLSDPPLRALCRIAGVVHAVDADALERLLGRTGEAMPEQLANWMSWRRAAGERRSRPRRGSRPGSIPDSPCSNRQPSARSFPGSGDPSLPTLCSRTPPFSEASPSPPGGVFFRSFTPSLQAAARRLSGQSLAGPALFLPLHPAFVGAPVLRLPLARPAPLAQPRIHAWSRPRARRRHNGGIIAHAWSGPPQYCAVRVPGVDSSTARSRFGLFKGRGDPGILEQFAEKQLCSSAS